MEALWCIDKLIIKRQIKKYKRQYPNEEIIFAVISKTISKAFEKEVKARWDYINAMRAILLLTNKNVAVKELRIIEAREVRIRIEEIACAELDTYNSLSGKAMVLKLKARDGLNYQFGMRYDERFFKQNVLRFEHREMERVIPTWHKLTYRILMPIWRLFIIGLIIYYLIKLFRWIGS